MSIRTTIRDIATMIRRDTLHARRNPMLSISTVLTPVIFLLLFVGVLGGSMATSLAGAGRGMTYIGYITPGIILMAVGSSVSGTAISVTLDKGEGIIARFRVMAIGRTAVLSGKAVGSIARTLAGICIVVAVALLLGFRSPASFGRWAEAFGFIAVFLLAMTWLAIGFGLFARSAAGANSLGLIPGFLPLVSSAFVPTASMPPGVRWFAENQPYTPIIETLRALLLGASPGARGYLALFWCAAIGLAGYAWARHLYNRDPSRDAGPSVTQLVGQ